MGKHNTLSPLYALFERYGKADGEGEVYASQEALDALMCLPEYYAYLDSDDAQPVGCIFGLNVFQDAALGHGIIEIRGAAQTVFTAQIGAN